MGTDPNSLQEHHTAFVLARRIAACADDPHVQSQMCEFLFERFFSELKMHFEDEEQHVLPVLRGIHEAQVNDYDSLPLLKLVKARFGRSIIVQYIQRKPGEMIIDFVRTVD